MVGVKEELLSQVSDKSPWGASPDERNHWRLIGAHFLASPLGRDGKCTPPLQPGEHKRRLFPSGEGACWSARCSTTTAELVWILHCIISLALALSLPHHLPLHFQGWATALFSSPLQFLPTPHLLPSPSSLLSALPCSSLLVCRQESKHWKAFAYCLSRTRWDN